jgi:hypothetical protein
MRKYTQLMYHKTTLILLVIILASCGQLKEKQDDLLNYTMVTTEFNSPGCQPETEACLMLNIAYPNFDSGDSLARFLANRIIKNSILDNIGMGDVESTEDPSIDQAIEDLSENFEELKKEFGDYGTGWEASITVNELFKTDSILVLETGTMTYFGGAHPNHGIRYFNFNRKAGNLIPLSDIVKDLAQFTSKAEKVFNKKYSINEDNTYDKAGYQFLGGKFILSANYAFLGDSIRLHYNPYEIAPYSMGDSEITVILK